MSKSWSWQDAQELYKEAIMFWGKPLQVIMVMEEGAELTKELSKWLRKKGDTVKIAEELADVDIMLEQLKVMMEDEDVKFGEYYARARLKKLERLNKLLEASR